MSPEAWLRGPVDGVPDPLQPIAHALLQAREEARRHIAGVTDRLFTYARGESLSTEQQKTLSGEGQQPEAHGNVDDLLDAIDAQVDRALNQLRAMRVVGESEK